MLALNVGFAVPIYLDVQAHGVAANRTVLNVVLVRAGRQVHGHDDLFTARVANVDGLLVSGRVALSAFLLWLFHGGRMWCAPVIARMLPMPWL